MTQDLTLRSFTQLPTAGRANEPLGGPSAGAGMVMMMGRAVPSAGSSATTPLPCEASNPVWICSTSQGAVCTHHKTRNVDGTTLCLV